MFIPVAILVLSFLGGYGAAVRFVRWPERGPGVRAAFVTVAALTGIIVALVALHVYEIVRELDRFTVNVGGATHADVIASGLLVLIEDVAVPLGLAAAVYLLALLWADS